MGLLLLFRPPDWLAPTSITSAEAFDAGREQLRPAASSITTAEAFGAAKTSTAGNVTAIASGETFGSAREQLRPSVTAGVATGEASGTPLERLALGAQSIPGLEAFDQATATGVAPPSPPPVQSGAGEWPLTGARIIPHPWQREPEPVEQPRKAWSTPAPRPAARRLTASSTPTGEAFGAVTSTRRDYLEPTAIRSTVSVGRPAARTTYYPVAIDSAESFDPARTSLLANATSILSSEAHAQPLLERHDSDEEILALLHLYADPVGSYR